MLGLAGVAGLSTQASAAVLKARSSAAFVDSVGVNVHMSYSNRAYRDAPAVLRALRRLGVRHVRDGLAPGRPDQYEALQLLNHDGIRSTLIVGDPLGRFGTLAELIPVIRGPLHGAVEAVEGANEYDRTHRADWPRELRAYQRRLAARVPRGVKVLGPTLSRNSSFDRLGRLPRRAVDRGNIHPYPDGERPDRPGFVRQQLQLGRSVSGPRAQWATETGYHTGVGEQPPVSERAAAIYLPRLLLTNFAAGIPRTYLYELLDQSKSPADTARDGHFGLLRANFREKPAARAVRQLLDLFGSAKARRCTGRIRVRVTGGGRDLKALGLRRCGGRRLIALWHPERVYDAVSGRNLRGRYRTVRLRFPRRMAGVKVYSPTSGDMRGLRAGKSLSVRVGPSVRVIALPARRSR